MSKPRKKWKVTIWREDSGGKLFIRVVRRFTDEEWAAYAEGLFDGGRKLPLGFYQDAVGCYVAGATPGGAGDTLIREKIR